MKKQKLLQKILDVTISLRPQQWLKNTVVFAAILFSRDLFTASYFYPVFFTFIIFCLASSAMYLINDVLDRESDKLHFAKSQRPIAAGRVSAKEAVFVSAFLAGLSIIFSIQLSNYLLIIILLYFFTQIAYSFWLKNIIMIDILVIALSFMLRVFAGSVVVIIPLSAWLILTTIMLSLFLAIGKRRSELTLLRSTAAFAHRRTLIAYPSTLLDGLVFMMATSSLVMYSLFTFNAPETVHKEFFINIVPTTLSSSKLLMATIPFVIYGIFRYLYLIFEKSEGDSPEKVFLGDKPLLICVLLWLLGVLVILYFLSI